MRGMRYCSVCRPSAIIVVVWSLSSSLPLSCRSSAAALSSSKEAVVVVATEEEEAELLLQWRRDPCRVETLILLPSANDEPHCFIVVIVVAPRLAL